MGLGFIFIVGVVLVLLFDGGAILERILGSPVTLRSENRNTPQQKLDKRLARGEIDLDEYQKIREHLENSKVVL